MPSLNSHLRQLNLKANRLSMLQLYWTTYPNRQSIYKEIVNSNLKHRRPRDKTSRQWYRLHPTLASKNTPKHFELDNTDDQSGPKSDSRIYKRNTFAEKTFKMTTMAKANFGIQNKGIGFFNLLPSFLWWPPCAVLKDFRRQHADRRFFNEDILVVHWIGWLPRQSFSHQFEKYVNWTRLMKSAMMNFQQRTHKSKALIKIKKVLESFSERNKLPMHPRLTLGAKNSVKAKKESHHKQRW